MSQPDTAFVTDKNGQRAEIESMPTPQTGGNAPVLVRLENGQKLLLPLEVLTQRGDGSYSLPFALSEFLTVQRNSSVPASPVSSTVSPTAMQTDFITVAPQNLASEHQTRESAETAAVVVPVIAEELTVGKREVEMGGVRILKTVSEREETVDVPLMEEHIDVQRIAINRVLDGPMEMRREGDVLIVPLMEEVLVVEKRLMLKEELHLRMRREEVSRPQQVTLRSEDVQIERFTSEATEPQPTQPSPIQTQTEQTVS